MTAPAARPARIPQEGELMSAAPPVDTPFRIKVEPSPAGVVLDVEPFVESVVHDVVEALLTDTYADRLAAVYDAQPRDPYAVEHMGELRFESLVADLVAKVSTKLPVHGLDTVELAGRIIRVATPAVGLLRAVEAIEGGAAA